MKKLFEFKTKTIVATGLGAALFTLLFKIGRAHV